jgi:hypothetical protein
MQIVQLDKSEGDHPTLYDFDGGDAESSELKAVSNNNSGVKAGVPSNSGSNSGDGGVGEGGTEGGGTAGGTAGTFRRSTMELEKIFLLFKPGHYDMLYSKPQGARAKEIQTLELQKFCRTPWECSICCDEEGDDGVAEIIKPWLCDDAICVDCDEPFAECPTCKAKRREAA